MDLSETVSALMQEGKGILFTTESTQTENERLQSFGLSTEDARRAYRELLFTTPGLEGHLSGVILSSESAHESESDGTPFPKFLASKNILSGILCDATLEDEKISEALREYASHDIAFSVSLVGISVSNEPVTNELQKQIHSLAHFAKISLAEELVPVLALDVSMNGAHAASHTEDLILEMLSLLSDELKAESVDIENVIVAVSMAVSGKDAATRAGASEVAERSVRAVTTAIPEHVGGVVFLSDAQSSEDATANLNALARLEPLPWPIAFCFSRALQDPVLAAWKGSEDNFSDAQAVFEERLSLLSRADAAGYAKTLEQT